MNRNEANTRTILAVCLNIAEKKFCAFFPFIIIVVNWSKQLLHNIKFDNKRKD